MRVIANIFENNYNAKIDFTIDKYYQYPPREYF